MTKKLEHEYIAHTERPALTWDEQGQPYSTEYDDVYYSTTDALAETRFVFLDKNNLAARWPHLTHQQTFTVCETGFGAGLNFLATWQLWRSTRPSGRLHFISFEKHPLNSAQIAKALNRWPQFAALSEQLCALYPPSSVPGFHHITLDEGQVQLTLYFGDAKAGLEQLVLAHGAINKIENRSSCIGDKQQLVDAWYFDGFTPAKNPSIWQPCIFTLAAELSKSTTTFATFTSARSVRDAIENAGFKWQKVPGFGLKREMLFGTFEQHPFAQVDPNKAPTTAHRSYRKRNGVQHSWHLQTANSEHQPPKTAIVIGGGLAGAHAAHALALRGVNVTLLERAPNLAKGASSNLQGLVYTRLSLSGNPLSRFNMAAQLYADRFYHSHNFYTTCGEASGVLHLATSNAIEKQLRNIGEQHASTDPNPIFNWVEQQDTEQAVGVSTSTGGLFIRNSGWLNPVQLCHALTNHPRITKLFNSDAAQLQQDAHGQWLALTNDDHKLASADITVICTARDAKHLAQTAYLPMRNIRGQVSHLSSHGLSQRLHGSVCGAGYIAPAQSGIHCAGASFNLHENTLDLREEDHQFNIDNLASMSKSLTFNPPLTTLDGKVGFRATTPDYFPIVGPVPMRDEFCERFAGYRKRAATPIPQTGPYYRGLYVSVGYGSRGLAYTPLATESLCHSIFGELQPIATETLLHLHPARFLFRDLTRNRI